MVALPSVGAAGLSGSPGVLLPSGADGSFRAVTAPSTPTLTIAALLVLWASIHPLWLCHRGRVSG